MSLSINWGTLSRELEHNWRALVKNFCPLFCGPAAKNTLDIEKRREKAQGYRLTKPKRERGRQRVMDKGGRWGAGEWVELRAWVFVWLIFTSCPSMDTSGYRYDTVTCSEACLCLNWGIITVNINIINTSLDINNIFSHHIKVKMSEMKSIYFFWCVCCYFLRLCVAANTFRDTIWSQWIIFPNLKGRDQSEGSQGDWEERHTPDVQS